MKRQLLAMALAMGFGPAFSCMPPTVTWLDALGDARGASIFSVKQLASIDGAEVVQFWPKSVVHGRGRKDMPFYAAAGERPYQEQHPSRSLPFWAGLEKALDYRGGSCALVLRIDYSKDYLVLWGHDGPYAIEPVLGDADDWVNVVRQRLGGNKVLPSMGVAALRRGLRRIGVGKCSISFGASSEWDAFEACVESIFPVHSMGPRPLVVALGYDAGDVAIEVDRAQLLLSEHNIRLRPGIRIENGPVALRMLIDKEWVIQ